MLITTAYARQHSQFQADSDELLTTKIQVASAQIERYCNRHFTLTQYLDNFYETSVVYLTSLPVSTVDILTVYDWDGNGVELDDYRLDEDIGKIQLHSWYAKITVEYTAGFSPIPADVQYACVLQMQHLDRSQAGDITKEKLGDYLVEYATNSGSIPKPVRDLLGSYRLMGV